MLRTDKEVQIMKVAGDSNVRNTAGSIAKHIEEGKEVEIVTVGAGALNQAKKAIIAASMMLASKGLTVYEKSGFTTVEIAGEERTAISTRLVITRA